MRESLATGLLILVLLAGLLTSSACAPGAKFELGNLTISPSQALEGNSVLVSVDVTNSGDAKGDFNAKLKIDETLVATKSVTVAAGQTLTTSFIVDAPAAGTHDVELNGLTNIFSVLTPLAFANLVISPAQAQVGGTVGISADISNTGNVAGNYSVALKINGSDEKTKTVELDGNMTLKVVFDLVKDSPGVYAVSLGNLSGNFTLLTSAEFTISNLVITPPQALPGRAVFIICNVTNSGEVDGYYPASLRVDGVIVGNQEVLVPAGATRTVTFSQSEETSGTHDVSIGNLSAVLQISEGLLPPWYVGDKWVYREVDKGNTYTRTETVTGEEGKEGKDCYVKKITYDPPMDGWISQETQWIDKATHRVVVSLISTTLAESGTIMTRLVTYSRELTGSEWPYETGNEFSIQESWQRSDYVAGQPYIDTGSSTVTYRCTTVEDVTVEAGTFRCFKIIAYENGQATTTYWYSYQAKTFVKIAGLKDAHNIELLSYSVK